MQCLAAFLKAGGYLIPLMDSENALHYTRAIMVILIREFASPDEEMKKIVLKVSLTLISDIVHIHTCTIICLELKINHVRGILEHVWLQLALNCVSCAVVVHRCGSQLVAFLLFSCGIHPLVFTCLCMLLKIVDR